MGAFSKRLIITVVSLAVLTFLGIYSETCLAIVSPELMQEFNVSEGDIQWLTSGFLLILAVAIPLSPFLVKTVSTKLLFQMAVLLNIAGAVLGAAAVNFEFLLAGRLIMAVGTGFSLPLLTNIVLEETAPHERGALLGIAGFVVSISPVLGPILGGIISEYAGWRWIFITIIPVLIITFAAGNISIRDIRKGEKYYLDIKSFIISSLGLISFITGLTYILSIYGIILLAVSIFMLVIFLIMQTKVKYPLINIKVLSYKMFFLGLIAVCVPTTIILALAFLIPIYAQKGLFVNALEASFLLAPGAALAGILAPMMGAKYSRTGIRKLLIPGFTIMTASMLYLILIEKGYINTLLGYTVFMFGASLSQIPVQANTLNALPKKYNADGTAVLNTLQQAAGAAGTAAASALLTLGIDDAGIKNIENIYVYGIDYGYILCFCLGVIGFITAINIKTTIKLIDK